jgi:ABC-type multidrug transport system fused ATPase/permease subunit
MYNTLQSGMASAERVFDLLDEPEESPDREPPLPSPTAERLRRDASSSST